ncbi:MAG TPA: MOSC N-terminal beta barrel domain-containing protein [Polyangiaceae bacterium]|nr:MOSC N-terminal beta barrel domain-containing protein [Polyangiaceae bacterium]
MKVRALYVYPVKSGRGVAVRERDVGPTGLEGDRGFMVVDEHGAFITQREHPELARLRATLDGATLTLEADDGRPVAVDRACAGPEILVEVWGDRVPAVDCGGPAAGLLTNLTGRLARLVRLTGPRPVDPEYAEPSDTVSFADAFPLLVATTASIEHVARRIERPADARRYRPNIVIEHDEPFAEDAWTELEIGGVRMALVKPCSRCSMLDVDPDTGKRDGAVLAGLATLRTDRAKHKVFFGVNAIPRSFGSIAVGDDARAR